MTGLSPIAARAAAGATLVAVLAVTVGVATAPYLRLFWLHSAIIESRRSLDTLNQQMASEDMLKKENSELAVRGRDASLLLKGDTVAIAEANLQKLVSSVVSEYGAGATSYRVLPSSEDGSLVHISLGLSANVSIDGLRDILHRLETGAPLLFVNAISVRAPDNLRTPDPNYLGPLAVTLEVSAYCEKIGSQ